MRDDVSGAGAGADRGRAHTRAMDTVHVVRAAAVAFAADVAGA